MIKSKESRPRYKKAKKIIIKLNKSLNKIVIEKIYILQIKIVKGMMLVILVKIINPHP